MITRLRFACFAIHIYKFPPIHRSSRTGSVNSSRLFAIVDMISDGQDLALVCSSWSSLMICELNAPAGISGLAVPSSWVLSAMVDSFIATFLYKHLHTLHMVKSAVGTIWCRIYYSRAIFVFVCRGNGKFICLPHLTLVTLSSLLTT